MHATTERPMQVCTCAKFRKRMDNKQIIQNKTPKRQDEDELIEFNVEHPKTSTKPTVTSDPSKPPLSPNKSGRPITPSSGYH